MIKNLDNIKRIELPLLDISRSLSNISFNIKEDDYFDKREIELFKSVNAISQELMITNSVLSCISSILKKITTIFAVFLLIYTVKLFL